MLSPRKHEMQEYFLIGQDGKERSFSAIDDSQATGLCQKQYPGQHWELYRQSAGERVEVCTNGPDCSAKKSRSGQN